jgi:2-hydroxychromene-2-carboxylate isomerase
VFHHYWGELEDISKDEVLRPIVTACGMDPEVYFEKIGSAAYKERLRLNTDELVNRGGFGSPTFFLDGSDMYFGNDRLLLIESRLG